MSIDKLMELAESNLQGEMKYYNSLISTPHQTFISLTIFIYNIIKYTRNSNE